MMAGNACMNLDIRDYSLIVHFKFMLTPQFSNLFLNLSCR